jgi:hypothetical protein
MLSSADQKAHQEDTFGNEDLWAVPSFSCHLLLLETELAGIQYVIGIKYLLDLF